MKYHMKNFLMYHRVEVVEAVAAEDVLSINTPEQLAEVDAILSTRMEATR